MTAASTGAVPGQTILAWAALAVVVIFASQYATSTAAVRYTLWLVIAYLLLTNTARWAGPISKLTAGLGG